MAKKLRAINALPEKCVIGKFVKVTPGNFDSDKILHAGILCKLRKLWTVPKRVRQEKNFCSLPKFLLEEILPIEELPSHCFSRGQISIKFDPGSTYWLKFSIFDFLDNSRIQLRIIFFEPPIMSGTRGGKLKSRKFLLEKFELAGPTPCDFSFSLLVGPEPSSVNMAMSASKNLMGARRILVRIKKVFCKIKS